MSVHALKIFRFRSLSFCCQLVSLSFDCLLWQMHTLWLKFVPCSPRSHRHVSCARWVTSSTSPFTSLPISSSISSSCSSCCFSLSTSLMSWITTTRTSAEELGPLAKTNSSTSYRCHLLLSLSDIPWLSEIMNLAAGSVQTMSVAVVQLIFLWRLWLMFALQCLVQEASRFHTINIFTCCGAVALKLVNPTVPNSSRHGRGTCGIATTSQPSLAIDDLAWVSLAVLSISTRTTYIRLEVSLLIE